jgi:hypothetical protein
MPEPDPQPPQGQLRLIDGGRTLALAYVSSSPHPGWLLLRFATVAEAARAQERLIAMLAGGPVPAELAAVARLLVAVFGAEADRRLALSESWLG